MEGELRGILKPGIRDVVPVAQEDNLDGGRKSVECHQRVHIGKHLAGMEQIGERIDNRDRRTLGKLNACLMADRAGDDKIRVQRNHRTDIMHGFPGCHPDRFLLEKHRMPAELRDAHFKRDPCPQGRPLENQRCSFPRKRLAVALHVSLQFPREPEDFQQFFGCPEGKRNKVTFHGVDVEWSFWIREGLHVVLHTGAGSASAPVHCTEDTERCNSLAMA